MDDYWIYSDVLAILYSSRIEGSSRRSVRNMISSPKVGQVQLTDVDLEEFTRVHPKNDWHMLETARVKKSLVVSTKHCQRHNVPMG